MTESRAEADVVVVGGGLAGLTAANYLGRAGHRVIVHEARNRLGGRALTDERRGFYLNQGPHALYVAGRASTILAELGVAPTGNRPPLNGRYLFDGELCVAPSDTLTLLRTKALGLRGKAQLGSALTSLMKLTPADYATVSAADWVDGIAKDDRARAILLATIRLSSYVVGFDQMSADLAITQLQLLLGEGVRYLDGGWQPMVDQLAANATATGLVTIQSGSKVTEVPDARCVILAMNSPQAVLSLTGAELAVGPAATVANLDLGLSEEPIHSYVLGGYEPLFFADFSGSSQVAPKGRHLVTVSKYLAPVDTVTNDKVAANSADSDGVTSDGVTSDGVTSDGVTSDGVTSDGVTSDRAELEAFAKLCGVKDSSIVESRFLRRMVAASSVPTPALGGMAGRPGVDALNYLGSADQTLLIAGDWVGPEAHLADASIASAKRAAMAAIEVLK